VSRQYKFAEFIRSVPKVGNPKSYEYTQDLTKLYRLIWGEDDLTKAFEYQDELNEKWVGIYPAVREL